MKRATAGRITVDRFNREHPLIFDVIAMALTLLLAVVCSGVVLLLDRIAR